MKSVQPLKFGNEWVISPHTQLGMCLPSHTSLGMWCVTSGHGLCIPLKPKYVSWFTTLWYFLKNAYFPFISIQTCMYRGIDFANNHVNSWTLYMLRTMHAFSTCCDLLWHNKCCKFVINKMQKMKGSFPSVSLGPWVQMAIMASFKLFTN